MKRIPILIAVLVISAGVGLAPIAGVSATSTFDVSHDDPSQMEDACEFPVTKTDATGTAVTLDEKPERVTTISPSAAQTMWEIGAADQVVGVSQFAMYLDGAEEKADVSADYGASVEQVVATEPDLVLAPNVSAADVEPLREAGLTVYHFPAATDVSDIKQKTTTIGQLTGNCEGAAETNAWVDANVEAIESVTAEAEDRPLALYPLGDGFVAGGDTFIHSIITLSGADNAAVNQSGYPQLSDEVVLEMDPDVLVVTQEGMFLDQEPYASTTAGETESEVVVNVQWLNQPAPRSVVEATHTLTSQLHPDLYDEDVYVERSEISLESDEETPTETDESEQPTEQTTEQTAEPTATDQEPTEPPETEAEDGSAISTPGFGVGVTLVAMLFGTLIAVRRIDS